MAINGVIKNGFLIENGQRGTALSEVMISGNIAQMLHGVLTVSQERLDTGSRALLPIAVADPAQQIFL